MINKKVSILIQVLVLILFYILFNDIKNNYQNEINYQLTRLFFANILLCTIYYIKKLEYDILFDSDEIFFNLENSWNGFHIFWFMNVLLNIGIIINNFSKKFFIKANSSEDWIYIFSMYLSTYIHYAMHNKITFFTSYHSQNTMASILHFIHYSNSFVSFLCYLIINQLSPSDDPYRPLQKLLFYLIFCKFFVVLKMPIAGDIGKICYSIVLLYDIKIKFDSIERSDNKTLNNNNNNNNDEQQNNSILDKQQQQYYQFLIILGIITFIILCYSVIRIYKAWKYLELSGFYNDRSIGQNDNLTNGFILQNNLTRQRAKSTDGLNEIELRQLKKTQLEAIQIEPQQSQPSHTCSICFLEIENNSTIYELQCNHIFHTVCIDSWLKTKNSCPNCRSKVIQRNSLMIVSTLDNSQLNSTSSNSNEDNNSIQQNSLFENIIRQQQQNQENQQEYNQQQQQQEEYLQQQDIERQSNNIYFPQTSMNVIDNYYDDGETPTPRTSDNLHSQQILRADS